MRYITDIARTQVFFYFTLPVFVMGLCEELGYYVIKTIIAGFLPQMNGRTCHLVALVSWASSPLLIVMDLLCDRSLDGGKVSPDGRVPLQLLTDAALVKIMNSRFDTLPSQHALHCSSQSSTQWLRKRIVHWFM